MSKIAIYPGSFDPITIGHLDIIERSAKIFDKVIVVVMTNYKKLNSYSFSIEERASLVEKCTNHIPNVTVESSTGLLADYFQKSGAVAIIKGLRAVSDFEDEFRQALINKKLNSNIETIFMTADGNHMFLSSSVIKQVCRLGGDVSRFLPDKIAEEIITKLKGESK